MYVSGLEMGASRKSHTSRWRCSQKLLNKGLLKVVETDHGKHDKNCFQIRETAFLPISDLNLVFTTSL